MPQVNLYNKNLRGNIGFFGSPLTTLGVGFATNIIAPTTTPGPGGTVVSTLPNTYGSTFPTQFSAITGAWSYWSPSNAIIPSDAIVDYACIIWSTAYLVPTTTPEPIALPITLAKPDKSIHKITPNPAYELNFNNVWWQFTHASDITSIMTDNQFGQYTVTGVPTGRALGNSAASCGGWGMYIVYSHPSFPFRNINLNVGATGFNSSVTITNLILPSTGPVNSKAYILGVQGDRGGGVGDSLKLNGTNLSGPFNPALDFMNCRYVDYTGLALQTKGSLIVETGSDYGYYSDQTVVSSTTALKNTDTQAVLLASNPADWAGLSQAGLMVDLLAANLSPIVKAVDKNYAKPEEIINYTVNFANVGSITAVNITFTDTLPTGLIFVPNSLKINGVSDSRNITTGVTLPDLGRGSGFTLTFQAQLPISANLSNVYNNFANLDYFFNLTPTSLINTNANSNIVTTSVIVGSMTKSVDKNFAKLGDTLNYTISLKNMGPQTITNAIFIDTIPTGTSFISNSLFVNGVLNSGNPNPPGVNIGTINPNTNNTITFQVIVASTIPSPNTVSNIATSYLPEYAGSLNTSIVTTTIIQALLDSTKSVSNKYAGYGTVLTYTIVLSNTGNTTITSIKFMDTIPVGTTYVASSLKQDATLIAGSPNPPGVTLPNSIKSGAKSTVTFKVTVVSIPTPNPIPNTATEVFQFTVDNSTVPNVTATGSSNSNTVNTLFNIANLSTMTKIVDKGFATLNDILTYTITIPNTGTTSANAVVFKDTIPTGTTFVPNSFTVNGVVKTGLSPAPPGVNIGTIPAGKTFTVTFKVTVNTIPTPNRVLNSSNTTFNYQVDPSVVTTTAGSANSNIVTTTITRTALISPTKSVDVAGAFIGDTITYTIGFKNTGTTTANNIFFTDTTPNGTNFVTDSVKVNGVTITGGTLSPPPGVSIPDLGVNKSATLTFQVVVNTTPSPNPTTNIGTTSYNYTDSSSGTSGTGVNNTNIVATQVYPDNNPFKAVDKQYATVGDTLTYTIGWINALAVQQTNVTFVCCTANEFIHPSV